jgi:hypothetical protein
VTLEEDAAFVERVESEQRQRGRLVNPKDVTRPAAKGKARLDLLEPAAEREIAKALAFGADKYGVRNFVTAPISARVYVAAMKRHIDAWLEGEDYAEDSGAGPPPRPHRRQRSTSPWPPSPPGQLRRRPRSVVGGEGRLDQRPGQGCRVTCVAHPDRPVHAHGMCRRCYDGRRGGPMKGEVRAERPSTRINGDSATVVTSPTTDLGDLKRLIEERGLKADEWEVVSATLNEWDGPVAGGGVQKLRQLKIQLKRRQPLHWLFPATDVDPRDEPEIKRDPEQPQRVLLLPDPHCPYQDVELEKRVLAWSTTCSRSASSASATSWTSRRSAATGTTRRGWPRRRRTSRPASPGCPTSATRRRTPRWTGSRATTTHGCATSSCSAPSARTASSRRRSPASARSATRSRSRGSCTSTGCTSTSSGLTARATSTTTPGSTSGPSSTPATAS